MPGVVEMTDRLDCVRCGKYEQAPELDGLCWDCATRESESELIEKFAGPAEVSTAETEELIVPAPTNPMAVARTFLDQRYTANGVRLIRHHRNTFWTYNGSAWPEFDERRLASDLYRWLEPAKFWKKTGAGDMTLEDFAPTKHKLSDVIDAREDDGP